MLILIRPERGVMLLCLLEREIKTKRYRVAGVGSFGIMNFETLDFVCLGFFHTTMTNKS